MRKVALSEFSKDPSTFIDWVYEKQQTLLVMRNSDVCVEVRPVPKNTPGKAQRNPKAPRERRRAGKKKR